MADTEVKKESNGHSVEPVNGSGDHVTVKEETPASSHELQAKIVRQVEHYFGDYNLPRDKFLKEQVQSDEGWVPMEIMVKFQRLASLSVDPKVIMTALKKGGSGLMEVDEDTQKIRRCPTVSLPEWNDERKTELMNNTVYVKGFEKTQTTLDDLLEFFAKYPNVLNVSKRLYEDRKDPERKKHFKGSVFVVFKDRESAQKFMDLDSIKSPDENGELIRKWQKDYNNDKDKEFEDKKKMRFEEKQTQKKANKFSKGVDKDTEVDIINETVELPLGAVLELDGFEENGDTKREDIKEKLIEDFGMEENAVAFIYYSKGETTAKLRFLHENNAKNLVDTMHEKLGDQKLAIQCNQQISFKVLEGEEEANFLEQCKKDIIERKLQGKKSHKRRGGFSGGRGRGGKRQRNN